jgi:hypothetical protein
MEILKFNSVALKRALLFINLIKMGADAKTRLGSSTDYRGWKILNLDSGNNAIPDLGQYLYTQKSYFPATVSASNQVVVNDDARFKAISGFINFRVETRLLASQYTQQGGVFGAQIPEKTGYSIYLVGTSDVYPEINLKQVAYTPTQEPILLSLRVPLTSQYSVPSSATVKDTFGNILAVLKPGDCVVLSGLNQNWNVVFKTVTAETLGLTQLLAKAANLSDLPDKRVARQNLGITDATDKVLSTLLPAYVDDVNDDYATLADLQAAIPVGSKGIIYITTSDDKQYRWSGSAYHPMIQTPGTTDAITEGVNNLFFTGARAIGSLLTGYAKAVASRAIAATDSVLVAISLLEKKADDNAANITGISNVIPANAAANNMLVAASSLVNITPIITPYINQDSVTITHNKNRYVFVQIIESDGVYTSADISQDPGNMNVVQVKFGGAGTGTIIVI